MRLQKTPPARRQLSRLATAAVCLLAFELVGCISPTKCIEAIHHDKLACRGWRARKDCFRHEGKDFKLGFLDGYIGAMTGGADICQPVVPPQRYWSTMGCRGTDCEVVTHYYNGWGQGVAAAAQDGMAGFGQVPLRPRPQVGFPENCGKSAALNPQLHGHGHQGPAAPYESIEPLPMGPADLPGAPLEETPSPTNDRQALPDYFPRALPEGGESLVPEAPAPELEVPGAPVTDAALEDVSGIIEVGFEMRSGSEGDAGSSSKAVESATWQPRSESHARISLDLFSE